MTDNNMKLVAETVMTLVWVAGASVAGGLAGQIGAEILDDAGHQGYDHLAYAENGFAGGAIIGVIGMTLAQLFTCGQFFAMKLDQASEDESEKSLLEAAVACAVSSTIAGLMGYAANGGESELGGNQTLTVAKQAAASAVGSPFSGACMTAMYLVLGVCATCAYASSVKQQPVRSPGLFGSPAGDASTRTAQEAEHNTAPITSQVKQCRGMIDIGAVVWLRFLSVGFRLMTNNEEYLGMLVGSIFHTVAGAAVGGLSGPVGARVLGGLGYTNDPHTGCAQYTVRDGVIGGAMLAASLMPLAMFAHTLFHQKNPKDVTVGAVFALLSVCAAVAMVQAGEKLESKVIVTDGPSFR